MVFLAAVVIFIWFNRNLMVSPDVVPKLDYAANDLLIQDAKHFALLHGNYSRVGFFHPGPFYLQAIAFVEWLARDVLHAIATPIAAQALCAFLLNGAAIAALYLAMRKLFASCLYGAAGVLMTLAIGRVLIDPLPAFFVAVWMPYLYMAASMLVVAAGIGMLATGVGWLPMATLGLCMLVHGHGSFIGLVPIMAVSMAATLWLVTRKADSASPPLFSSSDHLRTSLIVSAIVFALFALPIVANTILHFPGEIPKYFRFAGRSQSGTALERLAFLARFGHLSLLPIPAMMLLPAKDRAARLNRSAVLVTLATVLPASLLYVLKGIDTLEFLYPMYWAAVFLAGASAIAIVGLIRAMSAVLQSGLALLVAGCAVVSIPVGSLRVDDGVGISQPGAEFFAAAESIESWTKPGTFAWIDVDTVHPDVIFDMSSLAAVEKRRAGRLCVEPETMHVSYPPSLNCNSNDTPSVLLRARRRDDAKGKEVRFSRTALLPVASMQLGDLETFSGTTSKAFYGKGWSGAEPTGRWTDGKDALLAIPSDDLPQHFAVRLDFSAFLTPEHPSQSFRFVDGNGNELGRAEITAPQSVGSVTLQLERLSAGKAPTTVRILVGSPRSPHDAGRGTDARQLGLFLSRLEIISS